MPLNQAVRGSSGKSGMHAIRAENISQEATAFRAVQVRSAARNRVRVWVRVSVRVRVEMEVEVGVRVGVTRLGSGLGLG